MYPNSVNSYGKYYNHIKLIDGYHKAEVSETANPPIKDISSLKLDNTVIYRTSFIRDKETREIIGLLIEKKENKE